LIAIKRFDYRTKNKFISYGVWWIKQAILASIQDNVKSIRLPNSVRSELNKINRKEEKLAQEFGRAPTTVELHDAMVRDGEMNNYVNKITIDELFKISSYETSLSNLVGTDTTVELGDLVVSKDPDPAEVLIEKQRKELLMKMVGRLPRHIQQYLIEYYGIGMQPMKLKEMAAKYDISKEAIKQSIDKYTRRMRCTNHGSGKFFFPTPDYGWNRD